MLIPSLFYISAAMVVYAYAVFPALLLLRAVVWCKPYVCRDITPTVSMIICCHNEQDSIEGKLKNCLALNYPREKLEIIVASDGSDDRTEEIVSRFEGEGVTLLSLPRGGKALALNAAVGRASGEVLVFSDANSMYATDAIGALVRPLADPSVGGVAGDQRYVKQAAATTSSHDGEQSYWNYDRWLKRAQSCSGSVTSATGAIYSIRRALFQEVPSGVTDDFVTSARVVAQGYRLVFAREAIAYEQVAGTNGAEFRRKVRLMTRGLQGVLVLRRLLNPFRYGLYSLQLFSHKVLRRLLFLWLITLLATSLLLYSDGVLYRVAAITQLLCYGCAIIGTLFAKTRIGRLKPFSVPAFFVMANAAAMIATLNLLRGRKIDIWQPSRNDVLATPSHT